MVLLQTYLEADSPGHAWYQLRLIRLAEGYVVEKKSGRRGRKGQVEAWFRWDSGAARCLYDKILDNKTREGRRRVYRIVPSPDQLELFPESKEGTQ
ncbi:hypothetical protein [Geothermobacter hydrogeniphilus]|uniref:WGR domain-containing protein n=1 Tax=Geothermobacter hydrogeniphilus TaxID=1969733 RepID=A0A1X0Y8A1_9BACT|nr:hypothetical protein [Geothermobacter hydrogeniphilus]ORJ61347.1 hypothetical protein B5V00_06860 [Geothermobacter hydrogeniphilus]